MPRPIILGVVGDSAAGKTTITRGLVRLLGDEHVTHVAADDYHRYDRRQRAERGITPLHPDCNYLDIMEQRPRARCAAAGRSSSPSTGTRTARSGPPVYVEPRQFTVVEGLLGYHTQALRDSFDVRVFLAPPEELRRQWKVQRDCTRRGYTSDQVLEELDRREARLGGLHPPPAALGRHRRLLQPGDRRRPGAPRRRSSRCATGSAHPDLSALIDGDGEGMRLRERRRTSAICGSRATSTPVAAARGRGGDLGSHALRQPPALRAPGRVHRRAPSCTARSRWRSCSCWSSTTWSRRGRASRSAAPARAWTAAVAVPAAHQRLSST